MLPFNCLLAKGVLKDLLKLFDSVKAVDELETAKAEKQGRINQKLKGSRSPAPT